MPTMNKCQQCGNTFSVRELSFCNRGCDLLLCVRCEKTHECGKRKNRVDPDALIGAPKPTAPNPNGFEVIERVKVPSVRVLSSTDPRLFKLVEAVKALPPDKAVRWPLPPDPKQKVSMKAKVKNFLTKFEVKFRSTSDLDWVYFWRDDSPPAKKGNK